MAPEFRQQIGARARPKLVAAQYWLMRKPRKTPGFVEHTEEGFAEMAKDFGFGGGERSRLGYASASLKQILPDLMPIIPVILTEYNFA